jgi:hypothetical protein
MSPRALLWLVAAIMFSAVNVHAQTDNRLAIGVNFSTRDISEPDAAGRIGLGLTWRLGHGSQGWGWKYGLGWFSTDLDGTIDGDDVTLGKLRVRPFMGGYGYTHVIRNVSVTAKVLGGYALTKFTLEPAANDAYRERLGAATVRAEATNTFVLRPEIGGWIDLNRKIGIQTTVSYQIARPEIVITSSLGEDRRRVRADALRFKVGVVYSIF